MRAVTREAERAGITPLLAARARALLASFTGAAAALASPPWIALRAFLTAVRTALLTARLRVVRAIRCRLRLSAEAWFAMFQPTWFPWLCAHPPPWDRT